MIASSDLAICTIHGSSGHYSGDYARRYSWAEIQMRQLRAHTPPGFTVYAYGNRPVPEHREFLKSCPEVRYIDGNDVENGFYAHVWPIRNWLTLQAIQTHRVILHLDSDAFPVTDDWFPRYASLLTDTCPVVAACLSEIGFTQSDRLFLMFTREGFLRHRFDFSPLGADDPGGGISAALEEQRLSWVPLLRSNAVNFHRSQAGLYDHRIYHQGAGSRLPKWMDSSLRFRRDDFFRTRELLLQGIVMDQVFFHTEEFMAQLKGERPPMDMDAALLDASRETHPGFHRHLRARLRRGVGHHAIGYTD